MERVLKTKTINSKDSLIYRIKKNKTTYFMLLPGLMFLAVFSIYPIMWVLRYMFYEYNSFGDIRFIGLDNFVRIFTRDKEYWNSIFNTFIYASGKMVITLPISFLLAVILNKKLRGRSAYRTIIFMPTVISIAIMSLIFYFIFNSYNGIINQLLMRFNVIDTPINWLGSKLAMLTSIIVAVWGALGNYMIYFLAGLQTIPNELYESASIDGASPFKQFLYITIPMVSPITQMVVMLAILSALKDYQNIMVLTGGGPNGKTEVMYLYIYRLFFPMGEAAEAVQQYGYGTAVAFVSSIIVGIITILYLRWSKKMKEVF